MLADGLISDFDNTISDRRGATSETVNTAIRTLIQSGTFFTIATGRPYFGIIEKFSKMVQLKYPLIVQNGAAIIDPTDGTILWKQYISSEIVDKLIKYCNSEGVFCSLETSNSIYTHEKKSMSFYGECATFQDIADFSDQDIPMFSITIPLNNTHDCDARLQAIKNYIMLNYPTLRTITFKSSLNCGVDIVSAKTSKHIAVFELMSRLKLNRNNIVGIGDSYNDYALLTACGIKVAMGNAIQELKDIADFIAPSQKENGVMTVINRYFPGIQSMKAV